MDIWQIDPVNLTPYYNTALCQALSLEGHQVRYVTSTFLYDPKLKYSETFVTDFHYFRALEYKLLLQTPHLRKILRAFLYPGGHWRLLNKLKRNKPDLVHFQWSRLPIFDRWLVSKIRQLGIPIIHTIHDVEPSFPMGPFTGQLQDVYSQVDGFVVHTQDSRNRFLKHFPALKPNSVHVIPLITTTDHFMPAEASQQFARQHLNINPEAFVILFFGSIKHYKGVDVLEKALPIVEAQYPDFQLWIVGRPETEQDAQLLDKLKKRRNIHIHSEYVPSNVVWQYHLSADVVVFPYRSIFQSAALNTAMGYGRAVIVTDVGGLPESIDGNGWIVPPENPTAFAEALIEAINNRAQLDQMGEKSLEIVVKRHGPTAVAHEHLALYRRVIDSYST